HWPGPRVYGCVCLFLCICVVIMCVGSGKVCTVCGGWVYLSMHIIICACVVGVGEVVCVCWCVWVCVCVCVRVSAQGKLRGERSGGWGRDGTSWSRSCPCSTSSS